MMRSPYSESETMDRFVTVVTNAGMKIFARIDHAAGAQQAGRSLRPTEAGASVVRDFSTAPT